MIKKISLFLLFSSALILAQNAGNSGLSFLKIGSSAQSIGASDIGLLNSDLSSVYYNPASVNLLTSSSVLFTHQMWVQDLTSEVLSANFSLFGLPFAVGVNTTKIDGFEVRTNPTETPDATFNVNYFYGSLSTGFSLYEDLKFGITIKYLYESLLSDDASGTGYDFGLLYSNLIDKLTLGASIRNLGSMSELRNEKTELPTDLIVNATYQLSFQNSSLDLLPVIGIQKYLETDNLHIHIGTETTYDKQFSLRAGYITGYDSKGFTAGAGVFWNGFNIDYAFTPFSYGIGNANTITLAYTF
jgi:hypothetical protein